MNSAPGSASSEPHPAHNTADALRPQKAEGDLVTGRDSRRGGAANRTTRTAERDIRDIGAPHTGLGCLTGPRGRCTQALNPRKESRIPPYRKPEKHCDINHLSRGGGGGIRTHGTLTRTTVFECGECRVRSVLKHLIWFGLSPAPVITEHSLRCGVLPSNVKSAANSAQRVSAGTRPRLFQKRLRCRTRT